MNIDDHLISTGGIFYGIGQIISNSLEYPFLISFYKIFSFLLHKKRMPGRSILYFHHGILYQFIQIKNFLIKPEIFRINSCKVEQVRNKLYEFGNLLINTGQRVV